MCGLKCIKLSLLSQQSPPREKQFMHILACLCCTLSAQTNSNFDHPNEELNANTTFCMVSIMVLSGGEFTFARLAT